MARIIVGTSGWHYASWRGPFFPDKLLTKHQLRFYASQFDTTELNGVFYRTPTEEAVKGWKAETGNDFVFAWKASKFITHWKRLSPQCENSVALLESRYRLLGDKGGTNPLPAAAEFQRRPLPAAELRKDASARLACQLRIPASELVLQACPRLHVGAEHRPLHLGSP